MAKFAQIVGGLKAGAPGAVLAPMAGISDLGMRRAAQKFGATLVVSEMVASRFYTRGDQDNRVKADGSGLACHVVQIAGCQGDAMAEAARQAEAAGADAVDINMGCPAKKVVGGLAGSALMRDLDQATGLIRAVVGAVSVPVTLKMRLGWDDTTRNAAELASRAEAEGVALVTVHGRTRCQFYEGRADWTAIRAVVDAVDIPVVANGDCASARDARTMLACSGAAAVMIGRAAVGQPWIVGEVAHALAHGSSKPPLDLSARRDCALEHYATLLTLYGAAHGVRHARKHLAGYATRAGHPAGTPRHSALVTETDPDLVLQQLDDLFASPAEMAA